MSESCCSETETVCSEGRFSYTSELNYVQRQTKTGIDVLHEATSDGYWNVDEDKSLSEPCVGVTRVELLNKNSQEGHMWVQGRTDKETGYCKTWTQLAGRVVKHPERLSAQSLKYMSGLDASRERRGIYFIPSR